MHVFGPAGSAEALGDTELVIRRGGQPVQQLRFAPIDSLRAELDAFFFRRYGIDDRDDVDYILETFQTETGGLKHNEIRDHGEYRTKRLVLTEYDRMAAADAGRAAYPITSDEMLDTIAAFEALVASANRYGQLIVLR